MKIVGGQTDIGGGSGTSGSGTGGSGTGGSESGGSGSGTGGSGTGGSGTESGGGSGTGGSGTESGGGSGTGGSGTESGGGSGTGGSGTGGSGTESGGGSGTGGSGTGGSSSSDINLIDESPITDDTKIISGVTYHADLNPGSKVAVVKVSDANFRYDCEYLSAAVIRATAPVKGSMDEQISDASLSELPARKPYLLVMRAGCYDIDIIEMDNSGSFFVSKLKSPKLDMSYAKTKGTVPFDSGHFTGTYSIDSRSGYFPCDGMSVGIMNDIPQDATFSNASRFPFIYVSCACTKTNNTNSILKFGLSGKLSKCVCCEAELMPYVSSSNISTNLVGSPSTYYDCNNTIYVVPTEGKYYDKNWRQITVGKGDQVVYSIGTNSSDKYLRIVEYDSDFLQSVGLYYDKYNGSFKTDASKKAKHTFRIPYTNTSNSIISFVVYDKIGVILFDDYETVWFINIDTESTTISDEIDESRIIKKIKVSNDGSGIQSLFIFRGQLYALSASTQVYIVKIYFAD